MWVKNADGRKGCGPTFPMLQSCIYNFVFAPQGMNAAEGIGSDHFAHLSAARGGPPGHVFYPSGRESTRRGPLRKEVKAPLQRRARTAYLRSRLLRGPRTAGAGTSRFLRRPQLAALERSDLLARGGLGPRRRTA